MNGGISNRRKQRKQSFRPRSLRSLLFRITPVIYKTLHWLNPSLSDSVRMRRWDPQSKLTSGLIEVNSVVYAEPNNSVKDLLINTLLQRGVWRPKRIRNRFNFNGFPST